MKLVGALKENIIDAVDLLLTDQEMYSRMSRAHNPYGKGNACELIVDYVEGKLSE